MAVGCQNVVFFFQECFFHRESHAQGSLVAAASSGRLLSLQCLRSLDGYGRPSGSRRPGAERTTLLAVQSLIPTEPPNKARIICRMQMIALFCCPNCFYLV